jgi:hypothetical protein
MSKTLSLDHINQTKTTSRNAAAAFHFAAPMHILSPT